MASPPVQFECTACFESFQATPITIHGDPMCEGCFVSGIKPQFEEALRNETKYPVTWAGQDVLIDDFSRFFSRQFLRDWAAKKEEVRTPLVDRLYCAGAHCGKFIGLKSKHRSSKKCLGCGGKTCADCSGVILDNENHVCPDPEEADPFAGLQRGRDYQLCPSCRAPINLWDGCNHVICQASATCRTQFCYICGEEADEDSGHWAFGNPCPRYNQPGADDEGFDDVPENDLPEEQRMLVIDMGILDEVAAESFDLLAQITNNREPLPQWLTSASSLAFRLRIAIGIRVLHLDPDVEHRARAFGLINSRHEAIVRLAERAQGRGFERFPDLLPIYRSYLEAREEYLRNNPQ